MKNIALIGSAFGHGAQIVGTAKGPEYLKETYQLTEKLQSKNAEVFWHQIIKNQYDLSPVPHKGKHFNAVKEHAHQLAAALEKFVNSHSETFPVVLGGDHSGAIGTWSGIVQGLKAHQNFGLIWFDAHMDAHTAQTSPSKAYHGMPVSVLLGHGDDELGAIGDSKPKIKPEHLVLVGIRSYESEEAQLLQSLGVKIFTNEDVFRMGIKTVLEEAQAIVSQASAGFGISFDMDALDPYEAPGVGSPEPNGLTWGTIQEAFSEMIQNPHLKALEVVEFNPDLDQKDKTAELIVEMVGLIQNQRFQPIGLAANG